MSPEEFEEYARNQGLSSKDVTGTPYLSPEILARLGVNVTDEKLGDIEFGEYSKSNEVNNISDFVNKERIENLKKSESDYDLKRLVEYLEELNDNYKRGSYLCVAMIGRSIINHVPPIFGYLTFKEVANNYGRKSFKKSMNHLDESMRSIADSYLHETIHEKETLPNSTQVNFSQDLDLLIAEIIRVIE
jgi:hypothetical protein